ncbi:unnamed protein product, partial [Didymodactylos carnosus]
TFLVIPELNHELKVFHDKRAIFNTLEELDNSISELLRNFDMTSSQGPDVSKIRHKIQDCTHELDMNFGLLGSLFRTGSRQTHFASQVTRFADIYGGTVVNLVYYPFFYFFRAVSQLMPHESTVDPEDPMDEVKAPWGGTQEAINRRRSTHSSIVTDLLHNTIHTYPDLPRHVTHDHDIDSAPGSDDDLDDVISHRSRTYTPPKSKN